MSLKSIIAPKYRKDPDLEFLRKCENEDLKTLSELLIYNQYGGKRIAGELNNAERFLNCRGHYTRVWDLIATEIQLFGGDAIINCCRVRRGILYRNILINVCKKLRVNFSKRASIEKIEEHLLAKVIEDALEKMTEEEKRDLATEMNIVGNIGQVGGQGLTAVLQGLIKAGGFRSYQVALRIANAIARAVTGRGLAFGVNAGLTRVLSILAGQVGWIAQAVLLIPIITGPAYRILIPVTIQVAYMRQKMQCGIKEESHAYHEYKVAV